MSDWLADPQKLRLGLQLGGVGVWRWRIGTDQLEWTENLEDVHRMARGVFDGTLSSFRRDIHPDDEERVWSEISRSIETGEPYSVIYRSAAAVDSMPLWIEAKGGLALDQDGERYLTGVCLDVTARVKSETELSRRLKQQEGIQRLSSYALEPVTLKDVMQCSVETAAEIFEVPLTKVLQFVDTADELALVAGIGWNPGLIGNGTVGIDSNSQAGFTLMSSGPVIVDDLTAETRFSGPPLLREHGVRSGMSTIITGNSDRPFGVFGIHDRKLRHFDQHDVAALTSIANIVAQRARQHEADARQRLVLREMAHRSGNLLQVVTSLASQTFRAHDNPQVAVQSFTSRLESLSRANHLIVRGGWRPTRLRSLVDEVLGAYIAELQIEGRDIQLSAEMAFDMALVLYELATNSLKYGSLSKSTGTVQLSWRIEKTADGSCFAMVWSDSAPVASHSRGTGFGSKLKRALIEHKWKGTMSISSEGPYRFSCIIPLPQAESSRSAGMSAESRTETDPEAIVPAAS